MLNILERIQQDVHLNKVLSEREVNLSFFLKKWLQLFHCFCGPTALIALFVCFAVISILFNFVKMFKRSYEENTKAAEMEKKKAEKDAKDAERERIRSSPKEMDRKRSMQDRKEADARFSPLRSRIG